MTGRLQIRYGKYYAILNTTVNGKRKQIWKSLDIPAKGNKRLAEAKLNELIYETKKKPNYSDVLLSDYFKIWLEHVRVNIDEVTYHGYKVLIYGHLVPYFEPRKLRIADVTINDIQEFMDYEYKSGRLDGKGGLSAYSLKHFRNVIHQTLKYAIKNGLLSMNAVEFVDLPKSERFEANFYSPEQLTKLFEVTKDDELGSLIKVAAFYGLRRSEVLGLKWDCINWDNNFFTIKHTVTSVNGIVEKDKTKTASSYRSLPMSEEIREIFQKQLEMEKENRKLFGDGYIENDYIFKWCNGKPYSPNFISKHFDLILKNNNLPKIRFHELRHSCASMLLNSGHNLEAVQKWMGHADIQMTANIYGHLDLAGKECLANDISAKLFKKC